HEAGTLRSEHIGSTVTLTGWVARRRDHGGVTFVDLRDTSGVMQVVVREEIGHKLRSEFVLQVTGKVRQHPEGKKKPAIATGDVELMADDVEINKESDPLTFQVTASGEETGTLSEEARLKYRYLDLRREGPAQALRLRSKVNQAARTVLGRHDFVEVETPTLTRSTPEGARDFLVPARLRPGSWY